VPERKHVKSERRGTRARGWMNTDKARYVFSYYGDLMTEHERLAYRHLAGTIKATRGRSDAGAQEKAKGSAYYWFRELLSDDPDVLLRARDGIEAFVCHRQKIMNDHRYPIVLNCCPRCGALARTPKARQCHSCRNPRYRC
jgi:hypothetical protein